MLTSLRLHKFVIDQTHEMLSEKELLQIHVGYKRDVNHMVTKRLVENDKNTTHSALVPFLT